MLFFPFILPHSELHTIGEAVVVFVVALFALLMFCLLEIYDDSCEYGYSHASSSCEYHDLDLVSRGP